jgi:starch phosphorylase
VDLIESLFPRHLQIIYEINQRFLRMVTRQQPGNIDLLRRVSLIDEQHPRSVRMAHLAIVGSHKVNGVSRMHTELMRRTLFRDFDALFPDRIINLTNGISQRTWLNEANPGLASLISSGISRRWLRELDRLHEIAPFAEDPDFRAQFAEVKRANKEMLAKKIAERLGLAVDPASLFDLHVKRIHEYKRQLLNLLQVIGRYNRIRAKGGEDILPRTVIFSGKAAPGYAMAKRIIHLINFVADVINNDPAVHGALKVVFVPNYDVQTAQDLIPAADLSQQISAAGTEASGTGNMKLALNGALTIATHDGANDEIAEVVGADNIFMFGNTVDEMRDQRARGYDPARLYESNPELKQTLDMIRSGYFSPEEPDAFVPIFDSLVRHGDHYMVLADYEAYVACQGQVDAAYRHQDAWLAKAIRNVANVGKFSVDRLVRDYANEVWNVKPVPTNGN